MGQIAPVEPVLLLVAAFSRHAQALDWAKEKLVSLAGPIALESPRFAFTETDYYASAMGSDLVKSFWAFERLIDPATLAEWKLRTNEWEREYGALGGHAEERPLNLDPGYLTLAKLVLASTKDHAHRLYIGQGIHAELTLCFRRRAWQPLEWTYPDYRRGDYHEFFSRCREFLASWRA